MRTLFAFLFVLFMSAAAEQRRTVVFEIVTATW